MREQFLSKRHVLIVEDQKDLQTLLKCAFDKTNCAVSVASNGDDAFKFLSGNRLPDIIILDLKMPVMDGFEFRRQQLGNDSLKDIPVFLYAAHDDLATIANDLKCDGFLHKHAANIKQLTEEVFRVLSEKKHS